ncbi:MAG: enoyl-CoA hydratase-related protein [Sphingobium sp.]
MDLRLERNGRIATLFFDRPEKRNAMNQKMWDLLPSLVDEAMTDDMVRVLVLASASHGMFCAGADIAEFAAKSFNPAWRAANQSAIRASQYALARAPKPIIAVIEGDCIGGGCGLAMACDMRIAAPDARFGITPARLGIVYSLFDTKLLVDLVGPARAKRIIFSAALFPAEEALRIGLIDEVDADPMAAAMALADTIAANAQYSIRAAKDFIQRIGQGQADDDEETMAMFLNAFTRPDFANGVEAFINKRAPNF